MKLTLLLLIISIFAVHGGSYSQNTRISVDAEEMSIEQLLKEIEANSGFRFLYNIRYVDLDRKVTVKAHKKKISEILDSVFKNTGVSFEVFGKQVIISKSPPESKSPPGVQQQKEIRGTVIDENEEPLPGVNIIVKGTTTGTQTDFEGQYSITANEGQTLLFTYIGLKDTERGIGADNIINVRMMEDAETLDEVILTAIGTKQFKDKSGATASAIDTRDIVKSGEPGLINSLAGKASGVRIGKSNGDPGSGSVIQIRGANTIEGASQPLIIVDGVPISNDNVGDVTVSQQSRLNDINPNDIASVQVLKGASAAALWGSRAANGVVVITTKTGRKEQKPVFTYSSSYSFDEVNVMHRLQNEYGQGRDGKWNPAYGESWGDKIADRSGAPDVVNENGAYFLSDTGERYYQVTAKNSRETFRDSNYDYVFRTGISQQHNLSVNGGGQNFSYFLSYGLQEQKGVINNFDYNRQNFRLNTQMQLTDWLNWNNKVSYTISKSNRVRQAGEDTNGILLGLLRTAPDFDITDYKGTYVAADGEVFPNRQRSYRRHLGESANPVYNNPLWTLNEQKNKSDVNRFMITPEFQADPLPWLHLIFRGGIDYSKDTRNTFFPIGSAGGSNSTGSWSLIDITTKEYNLDAIATSAHSINEHIDLTATLGVNLNDRQRSTNTNTINPFSVDSGLLTPDLNPNQAATSWDRTLFRIRSNRGYGILNLGLYEQLFINVSGAMEAASSVKGSFFYPSVDVAWQFSDLLESESFNFGKIRASWGKVGIQPNPYSTSTPAVGAFDSFGGSFLISSEKGDPNLKPETKTEWEVGTDMRFFNNRLRMSFTYYQNEIRDILFAVKTNPSSGFLSEYTNAGAMENRGMEIDLNAGIIRNDDLELTFTTNFNNNKNKVIDLRGAETVDIGGTSKAVVGHPMSSFWLPGTVRDDSGNMVLDENGFPQLDTESRVIGNPNPDWRGGAGMQLRWKGFDFAFLFEHSHGGDFIDRTRIVLQGFGVHQNVSREITLSEALTNVNGEVISAGTTIRGNIADFGAGNVLLDESWYRGIGGGLGFNKVNDLYVEDATWTKLRNVTLGYTFSKEKIAKLPFDSLRFALTGRDLILWTKLRGVDPETNNYGVSNAFGMNYFNNPGTRSLLMSVEVTF